MGLYLDESLAASYSSRSQKIRIMTETWLAGRMFCPCCGHDSLTKLPNNRPVADMRCDACGEIFELKSKAGRLGKKIAAGAYGAMIERIQSNSNPHLLILQYALNLAVTALTLVPKFFFAPAAIEKRRPLAATARRAGWTGCNILYERIPPQGKIPVVLDGRFRTAAEVRASYVQAARLTSENIDDRGWLFDVLNCVNEIAEDEFALEDLYRFEARLQRLHANNRNVRAKIRQQLQSLRDRGVVEFLERGHYRKSAL
ncbi:DpnI domain-containing protein [Pyramidobacter sp. YE332]|uniref:DpnI domain-containing protein n=1 Tax=Pyramidobacter sp. YE332 TaxID=3068894 RepID=UPI00294B0BB6|nr:DpnI domain-containing protein [Pyramidobacter sp. YE332]WOL39726.1 DpnI domain-containing protein [Pyramidobacter sp. YE332]